jgi:antitoxin HicB
VHSPQVDRLLDLSHSSKIEQIEAALLAAGKRLTIGIQDAA